MTAKECYNAMNADYEDVLKRMGNEERVKKYLVKYLKDPSYLELVSAMEVKNYKEALDAAHTLRGVCKILSFTEFENSSSELFESLKMENIEEAEKLLPIVKEQYKKTVDLIAQVK